MSEFFRELCVIEDEYAKRLLKLTKASMDSEGFGVPSDPDSTLKSAWVKVRAYTETTATRHIHFAGELRSKVVEQLQSLETQIKGLTTDQMKQVEDRQRKLKDKQGEVAKLNKTYMSQCDELEKTKEELDGTVRDIFF